MSLEDYINQKGWAFKFKNGEFCLNACPLCGAGPTHFYISQLKELFFCFKCGEHGHVLSLKKRLGDIPPISHISQYSGKRAAEKIISLSIIEEYHKALLENPAALAYLVKERAFALDTISKFKLGFNPVTASITIPHFRNGKCLNVKSRPISANGGGKYFREEGCASILFNQDSAEGKGWAVLCEGELDAIAFHQMGVLNTVAVTGGADTFLDEWVDPLEGLSEIFLSFDMDEKGRKGVEKVADKLGRHRCLNVLLPLKDANDCLKAGYSHAEMMEFLTQAKRFESKLIKSPESYFDQIRELHSGKSQSKGIRTGWNNFDSLLGGLRPYELTALTGETSSGKTTWATNVAYILAENHHPGLLASFEMKPLQVLRKMIQAETGVPLPELSKERLEQALSRISTLPIYFVDQYGELGLPELREAIYYGRRRYGIEFVILDHLHFFLKFTADHERASIDQALKDIKGWTMELGIHIFLIVHPTKLTYDNKVVHLNDLKGSSSLKQIPDNVFSIWRPRGEDNGKSPTDRIVLHILKVRDDSGDEGKIILTFDKRSQSYTESKPGEAPPPPPPVEEKDWHNAYDR
jgi:twinkle protein